jgi:hypothetical protein
VVFIDLESGGWSVHTPCLIRGPLNLEGRPGYRVRLVAPSNYLEVQGRKGTALSYMGSRELTQNRDVMYM